MSTDAPSTTRTLSLYVCPTMTPDDVPTAHVLGLAALSDAERSDVKTKIQAVRFAAAMGALRTGRYELEYSNAKAWSAKYFDPIKTTLLSNTDVEVFPFDKVEDANAAVKAAAKAQWEARCSKGSATEDGEGSSNASKA